MSNTHRPLVAKLKAILKAIFHRKRYPQLANEVRVVLKNHGKSCHSLEEVAKAIDYTQSNLRRKVSFYKWPGMILLVLIPLVATALTVVLAEQTYGWLAKPLSYSLTFLTILNSIFKPSERFRQVCALGVKIAVFKDIFLGNLEKLLSPGVEHTQLLEFGEQTMKRFAPFQEELIEFFLPETADIRGRKEPVGADRSDSAKPRAA